MDSKELDGIVLLHLSKAFDLVDHSLLLSKLKKYYMSLTRVINSFNLIYTIDHSAVVSTDHFLMHYLSHEVSHKALFWAPSFSCCTLMIFHVVYQKSNVDIFMLMTGHYGRLVLILQVYSMAFKVVSLKQITGSPETR